jgi:hypothetical protein
VSNSTSIVAGIFIAAGTNFLPSHCQATLGGGDTDAKTARRSHKPRFIFQNKESRLNNKFWDELIAYFLLI